MVELMVVLIIITVLASLALSRMGRPNGQAAASGLAHEIYALCQQARFAALSNKKQVRLTIQSQNPVVQYQTANVPGNQPLDATQFGPVEATVLARDEVQIVNVIAGAIVGGDPPGLMGGISTGLVFYPNGTVQLDGSDGTGATIYIADQVLRYPQRVLLYGRTGFAKVLSQ